MLPITLHSQEKLEKLFASIGYRIRYEKGHFKTGACIIQNSKVIVVNRFLSLEGKIQSLIELLITLPIDQRLHLLDEKQKQLLLQIKQTKLEI